MGTIRFRRASLLGCVSETVGYKSGLTLTREDLIRHAAEDDRELFEGADDDEVPIRSEEFEELIAEFLYTVGNIRSAMRSFARSAARAFGSHSAILSAMGRHASSLRFASAVASSMTAPTASANRMTTRLFAEIRDFLRPGGRLYFGWSDFPDVHRDLPMRLAEQQKLRCQEVRSKGMHGGLYSYFVYMFIG